MCCARLPWVMMLLYYVSSDSSSEATLFSTRWAMSRDPPALLLKFPNVQHETPGQEAGREMGDPKRIKLGFVKEKPLKSTCDDEEGQVKEEA
ncbi:hypothetical protein OPV22_015174 [Ensete ventricosum]|uniref:Uncharacterized protein n=1 Tax=Ensete ventricosum TaxID=4639 RepID=A0AAV8RBB1_ENSVE|nr:hypothetical protein OPV22_015174 [Ensete ventricosum]